MCQRNASTGVLDHKPQLVRIGALLHLDRDRTDRCELQRVRGEIQQHALQCRLLPHPLIIGRAAESQRETPLGGDRLHHVAHRPQHSTHRKRTRRFRQQTCTAARHIHEIIRHGGESKRRTVHQREMVLLRVVDRTAVPLLHSLDQQ